jgi:hypothetical protein
LPPVFCKLAQVSRHRRPAAQRVPPLICRRFTYARLSDSRALVGNGPAGRSSTRRKSAWCARRAGRTPLMRG